MDQENKYCIMDDVDVEYSTPVQLTEELLEKERGLEQEISEKYSYLFEK